jgi:hypothetical protein
VVRARLPVRVRNASSSSAAQRRRSRSARELVVGEIGWWQAPRVAKCVFVCFFPACVVASSLLSLRVATPRAPPEDSPDPPPAVPREMPFYRHGFGYGYGPRIYGGGLLGAAIVAGAYAPVVMAPPPIIVQQQRIVTVAPPQQAPPQPGMQRVSITVPAGISPGMNFSISFNGNNFNVACPADAFPGKQILIDVPMIAAPPPPVAQVRAAHLQFAAWDFSVVMVAVHPCARRRAPHVPCFVALCVLSCTLDLPARACVRARACAPALARWTCLLVRACVRVRARACVHTHLRA